MTTLEGKKMVVLGGTSGFGLATAEALVRERAEVIVASSRAAGVEAAVKRLSGGSTGHVVDVRDPAQLGQLFARVGAFDHLVFTAGDALAMAPLAKVDLAASRKAFELRFWGALAAAQQAAPFLRAGGSIVLTTGVVGRRPLKEWAVVASLTGAIEALTRALAVELAPIRVNAVCAGVARTALWQNLPEVEREAMFTEIGAHLPVGRVGLPADIAEAFLYLLRSDFSTGSIVVVDGGSVLV